MSALIPSATVILLREIGQGVEVLLLKRNSTIAYGGMWVFPGGKIDAIDYPEADRHDAESGIVENLEAGDGQQGIAEPHSEAMLLAAQNAAFRETQEEAGLHIERNQLVLFSHWTTPTIKSRRFSTWFFVAATDSHEVIIDGGEIQDHSWRTPADALLARSAGELELAPPTYVTLLELRAYKSIDTILDMADKRVPPVFTPRVKVMQDGLCYFYPGDAGYDDTDEAAQGARHRLYKNNTSDWVYERSD